ncbi:MAG: polysaccharide deacetylase family protein, partial [candidate division NC10 bacterium]|nr:polysaccharide deacetylase family protein [candidate division NC10 bacterium]
MIRSPILTWAFALLGILCPLSAGSQPPALLPILCYHSVSSHPSTEYGVSKEDFRAQMSYLKERGYVPISLSQWAKYLEGTDSLPARPVILTFDDGHLSAYQTIFPLLKSYGFQATFFLPTAFLSNGRKDCLTWPQAQEMEQAGMEMMPHGHSHANLAKRKEGENDASYRARVREEVLRSRSLIHSHLGRSPSFFAYPYGAFDLQVEEIVGEAGFSLILTACPGVNTPSTPPHRLRRQLIYRQDGLAGFVRKLEALPLAVQFPFEEGATLSTSPQRIDIELPSRNDPGGDFSLFLDRKPAAISNDLSLSRISLIPSPPLSPGLHILEVRRVEAG